MMSRPRTRVSDMAPFGGVTKMAVSDHGKFLIDEDLSFKKISPLVEEFIVMIRKHIQKIKTSSYNAKLMRLEDDMGWYTDEMRE
ncbi:hypothetical protein Tco_0718135 [Tanacetum coccineum]|uniref:Uncharacterized protein n=1 Tax=Tanacetum coccineum TaxID=301880 RepID=A0ABQ5BQ68_9ASTR